MMEKQRIGHTRELPEAERIRLIEQSARTIGRAVVSSILITLVSFAPILLLTGQEKKLFTPLVLTKSFCLVGSALVAVLILPMALRVLLKGKLIPNSRNPVSRFFTGVFGPVVRLALRWKKTVLALVLALVLGSIPLVLSTGTEFMPPLDEGSLLMMPTTLPDVSYAEAKRILQVQDKLLMGFPEVANVLGKAGRANTATDNAPLSMIETIILLKPRDQWRDGMTTEKLIAEMNQRVRIPGVAVGWTQPIINRINMLSTGIRTDVGVKIYGADLDSIYVLAQQVKQAISGIEGLADLYVEPLTGASTWKLPCGATSWPATAWTWTTWACSSKRPWAEPASAPRWKSGSGSPSTCAWPRTSATTCRSWGACRCKRPSTARCRSRPWPSCASPRGRP
ncbi:efflux RND transporter permease subunit (plasmid) [Hymenobacter sp. HDW8]|nr:efflux RND transporter permease subunit [Hymenobacter sp. HDW8]